MASINFPNAPASGQVYEFGSYTYTFDGVKWTSVVTYGSSAVKIQSDTAPGAPEAGLQWYDNETGRNYFWHINEGTNQGQWVEEAPQGLVDTEVSDSFVTSTGSVTPRILGDRFSDTVNVKDFGAVGDGVTDDTAAIQAAIDSIIGVQPTGGGSVYIPKGIYRTSRPIELYSDVRISGAGMTNTYVKPLDSAVFGVNEAVFQTVNFPNTQGTDVWDYYSPYADGLVMGLGVRDLTVDGNRDNVSNAGGLFVYGGKWSLSDLGIINTSDHGIWTECGRPMSSTKGDDLHDFLNMHEAYASNIYISNANKHGWLYRGPNDSAIGDVQIKTCKWGGFFQESTGDNSIGNLEISSIHAYSCGCDHDVNGAMLTFHNVMAQFVYVDASVKNGLLCQGTASIIDQILVLKNNQKTNGNYWGVILNVPVQIAMIRNSESTRTSGTDGGLLQVNSEGCVISQVRSAQASATTIAQVGIELNAACQVGNAEMLAYNTSSTAIVVGASNINMTAHIKSCDTAIRYNVGGRNNITLHAEACTNGFRFFTGAKASDNLVELDSTASTSVTYTGRVYPWVRGNNAETMPYSAALTPSIVAGSVKSMNALTGNLQVNAPTNRESWDELEFHFTQDATGGRIITWDPVFKDNYSDTGNTAYKRLVIAYKFDGFDWRMTSNTGWY